MAHKKSNNMQELEALLPEVEAARQRRAPTRSRAIIYTICLTFFLLLFWASQAKLDEVVAGSGQVVPAQRVQHVQNLEGGILGELLVREGQQVERGDLLLRIDNEQAGGSYRDALIRSREYQAIIARKEALLSGGDPAYPEELRNLGPDNILARHDELLRADRQRLESERRAFEAQLELKQLEVRELETRRNSLRRSYDLAVRQRDLARKLLNSRSYSEMDFLNLEQQTATLLGEMENLEAALPTAQAAEREAQERLNLHQDELQASTRSEINTASAELAALKEVLGVGADRVRRTEVRSPVRGIIKSIRISTEGGVIMPGEVIMDVVPSDDSLLVEAKVHPQDVAFIYPGQPALIRLSAYDFSIYGSLEAVVETISADTIEGDRGELFYLVKLKMLSDSLEYRGRQLPILPGMTAQADIITGRKSVLDYIVKPILKVRQAALRER